MWLPLPKRRSHPVQNINVVMPDVIFAVSKKNLPLINVTYNPSMKKRVTGKQNSVLLLFSEESSPFLLININNK